MTIFESLLLGAVQGITEFLPVSSSGHLIIAQQIFNIPISFSYGVLLNIGTLFALFIYFRERIVKVFRSVIKDRKPKYLAYVLAASAPTLIVGYLASDFFEKIGSYTWLVVLMLAILGLFMVLFGNIRGHRSLNRKDVITIALAQILALMPGTSRSGITILAGTVRGMSFKAATEFSFMLAIPTITAAVAHTLLFNDGIQYIKYNLLSVILGNLASFAFGLLAVKTLVNVLSTKGLKPFGWYRIALAATIPVVLLIKLI